MPTSLGEGNHLRPNRSVYRRLKEQDPNPRVTRQNCEHTKAAREQHRVPSSPPRRALTTPSPPRLPEGELALRALEEKAVKENLHQGLA